MRLKTEYEQSYIDINYMGMKKVKVYECIVHGCAEIDLLRDRKKLRCNDGEAVREIPCENAIEISTEIMPIVISEKHPSSIARVLHWTRDFLTDAWITIFHKPNIAFLYQYYILNWAKHAYKVWKRTVSMDRCITEAKVVFPSVKAFYTKFTPFFRERATRYVSELRHLILQHPYRIYTIDGNRKMAQKLYINNGHNRYQSEATYNTVIAASTGLIATTQVYPDGKETHERMTEMLVKPIVYSVNHSKIHKPLVYGIGIDHAVRDYSLPDTLLPEIVKQMRAKMGNQQSDMITSKVGVQYDLSEAETFVKFLYPIML